jgi:hypothetical protein
MARKSIITLAVLFGVLIGVLNAMILNAAIASGSPPSTTTTTTTTTTTVTVSSSVVLSPGFNATSFVNIFNAYHYGAGLLGGESGVDSVIRPVFGNPLVFFNPAIMPILYNYAPQLFPAGISEMNITILEPPTYAMPSKVIGLKYNSSAILENAPSSTGVVVNITKGYGVQFSAGAGTYMSEYVAYAFSVPKLAIYNDLPGITFTPLSGEGLIKITPTFSGVSKAFLYMASFNGTALINAVNITALQNNTAFTYSVPLGQYPIVFFVYIISIPNDSVSFHANLAGLVLINAEVTANDYDIGFLNFNDTLNAPAPAQASISAMNIMSPAGYPVYFYMEIPTASGGKIMGLTGGSMASQGVFIKFPPSPFLNMLLTHSPVLLPFSAYVSYMPLFRLNTSLISAFNVLTQYPALYPGGMLNATDYWNNYMKFINSTINASSPYYFYYRNDLMPPPFSGRILALYPFLYLNDSGTMFLQVLIPTDLYQGNLFGVTTFARSFFTRYPPVLTPQPMSFDGFKFLISPSMLGNITSLSNATYNIHLMQGYPLRNVTISLNNVVNGDVICIPLPRGVASINATIIGNAKAELNSVGALRKNEACYSILINSTSANINLSMTYFLQAKLHLLDKLNHPLPFATPLIIGNGVKMLGNASLPPGSYIASIPAHPHGFQLVINGQPVPNGVNAVNLTLTLNTTGTELNLTYRVPVIINLNIVETPTGFINVVGHIRDYYGAPVTNAPVIVELFNSSSNALLLNATVTTDGNGNFHVNSNIKVSSMGVGTLSSSSPVYAEAVYPGSSDYVNNETATNQMQIQSTSSTSYIFDLFLALIALILAVVIIMAMRKAAKHAVMSSSRFNKRR